MWSATNRQAAGGGPQSRANAVRSSVCAAMNCVRWWEKIKRAARCRSVSSRSGSHDGAVISSSLSTRIVQMCITGSTMARQSYG